MGEEHRPRVRTHRPYPSPGKEVKPPTSMKGGRQTRAHTTKEGGDREPEGSRVWKAALGGGMMAGEGLGVGTPGTDLVTERLELQMGLMNSVDGTACSGPSAVPGVSTCSGQAGGHAWPRRGLCPQDVGPCRRQ